MPVSARAESGPGPRWVPDVVQTALAAGLALVVLPVGWLTILDGGIGALWTAALLTALVLLHLSVLGARRWPVPAYAVGAFAQLIMVLGPDLGGPTADQVGSVAPVLLPSSICYFVILYGISAYAPRPFPLLALVIGLVGCVLTTVRLWGFAVADVQSWTLQLTIITAAVAGTLASWALGRFRATQQAWVGALAERGAADERRRIAREMHDVVAHSLAVVVSHAEAGRLVVATKPERAPELLDTIAETGRGALAEMRGLLGVLRDGPESTTPQPGLGNVPELVERMRSAGLPVDYDGEVPTASPAVGLTAYRVVQEALTNVTRHAGPGVRARVRMSTSDGWLRVEITDDGSGAAAEPGRGLTGMRERVEAVGGTLTAGPDAHGWRVCANLPAGGGP